MNKNCTCRRCKEARQKKEAPPPKKKESPPPKKKERTYPSVSVCSDCGKDSAYGTCNCSYNQYVNQYAQYCQDVWNRYE